MSLSFASDTKPNGKRTGTVVHYHGYTEPGRVRTINQDSFFVGEVTGGYLAVVADGMGGHNTGEVASQKAVEIISRELSARRSYPPAALAKAVQAANLDIYQYAQEHREHHGMGTTLTTLYIDDQIGLIGHVGDSRLYLLRGDTLRQLTFDHSWVAEQVRQGILTDDEAKRHRLRNVITNALGAMPKVRLELSYVTVVAGDTFLLCSDGISMLMSEGEITQLLSQPPAEAVDALMALANKRGSPDNITAIVLKVEAVEVRSKRYALPPEQKEATQSVTLGGTMTGIRRIEERFPRLDFWSKLKRQPWYPYRFWLLGSFYLLLLIIAFIFWGR
jgi:protein phosphatase